MTPLDRARDYLRRGWAPIPVLFRRKEPGFRGWERLRLTDERALTSYFNGGSQNVGVLQGEPSGGLVDVDLDCPEALRLAPVFLPPTGSRFGRASRRGSHWLYIVTTPVQTEKFDDPDTPDDDKATLVELRSTGVQTVFPGSVHESGEPIDWDEDGTAARGDGVTLRAAVADLAAACLVARHWPAPGRRHDAALAIAGLLIRAGFDAARAECLVYEASRAAGDDEAADRRRDVHTTATKVAAGEPVTGGPTLAELLRGDGPKVVATLRRWLGLQALATEEPLTDVTNAARFVEQHGASFRYCYAWAAWLHYDGRRWRRDAGDIAVRCAKDTARRWFADAAHASDDGRRKGLAKWATYTNSEPGLRRMLSLAQAELAVPPDQFDADPWLLNCRNGTLELRTGHLRQHRREDFLTKMTAVPYDPEARHPVWETFLARVVPDDGVRAFLQRTAGYCLTGSTAEEKLFFVHGPTAGGKSTYLGALRKTWGDYATTADFSTWAVRRPDGGPREDIARLHGARLVVSSEVKDGTRLAEGLIKTLTGGDHVVARRLYEQSFEFLPTFKLCIAANHRPRVRDDDDATWRRIVEVPFRESLPPAERDPAVKATLLDPAQAGAAILAWAAAGAVAWCQGGLGQVSEVERATAEYRTSMDPLRDFFADCCVFEGGAETVAGTLRQAYDGWCRDTGVRFPLSPNDFAARLKMHGCLARRTGGARVWRGVRLRRPDDPDPDRDSSDGSDTEFHNSFHARAHEGGVTETGVTGVMGVTGNDLPGWVTGSEVRPGDPASVVGAPPTAEEVLLATLSERDRVFVERACEIFDAHATRDEAGLSVAGTER